MYSRPEAVVRGGTLVLFATHAYYREKAIRRGPGGVADRANARPRVRRYGPSAGSASLTRPTPNVLMRRRGNVAGDRSGYGPALFGVLGGANARPRLRRHGRAVSFNLD